MPEERKKAVLAVLQEQDQNILKEQLHPYISTEEYEKLLEENTKKLLQDYLETIMPTLSQEQENEINAYLSTFTSDTNPASL